MKYSADQIVDGIIDYVDGEIIAKLPTTGKWIVGAGIGVISTKADEVINYIIENKMMQKLGIIDDSGMFDIDLIAENLKESAAKYGKMTIQLPIIGKLTFSDSDVENLKSYIERE